MISSTYLNFYYNLNYIKITFATIPLLVKSDILENCYCNHILIDIQSAYYEK